MKRPEDYIPESHQPHAKAVRNVFERAYEELALPAPATHLAAFKKLNQMTGGFRPNEFSILCGATGSGKTTLCANISADLIAQNVPHFVASVETGPTDFVKRVISAMVGADWNTGDPVTVERLERFHAEFGERFLNESLWLSLYEDRFSVETLMADIAFMVKHHGIKLAIIDNLNFFLDVTAADKALVEMDRVIHSLIIFAKVVPVHILMVMHPKKTDHGRVESEFDIKGSATAVQEAHNVFLFNRPHADIIKSGYATEMDRELMIAKMRRRGKHVRSRLILKSSNGVSYEEGVLL